MGNCTAADTQTRATTPKFIIGKIPGYNSNILPTDQSNTNGSIKTNSELYTNRLLVNLNTVEFTPIAYRLKFDGLVPDLISEAASANVQGLKDSMSEAVKRIEGITEKFDQNDTLATMGSKVLASVQEISSTIIKDVTVTRRRASTSWIQLLALGILGNTNLQTRKDAKLLDSLYYGFTVLGTNDSTFNETISNEYGANRFQQAAEDIASKVKESAAGNLIATVGGFFRSYDSENGVKALQEVGKFGLLGAMSGLFQGVKIQLPQVWNNSDYNSSLNIMIRLISPSGDQMSIRKYIKEPLEVLIRAAAPITMDGIMSGYPMIWDVKAHGVMHLKMATITAITITRGGNDTVYNKYDEPLNVDVRLMITPINPGFAQGPMCDYSMTDPTDIITSLSSAYSVRAEETINGQAVQENTKQSILEKRIYI